MKFILLILFLIIIIIVITFIKKSKKIAISLLTIEPNKIWLDFLLTFKNNYDIFIFIDNNNIDINLFKNNYPSLNFIQIDNNESIKNGYSNSSYNIKRDPISWDKALYYFTLINKKYKYVWFVEDDVFINSVNNIINLDKKYNNSDLIVRSNNINPDGKSSSWNHWDQVNNTLELPWSMSMVCICRLSDKLLNKIYDFTKKNGKLNFIEFLFNTIALHNNYIISNPTEFEPIVYRYNWDINNIDNNLLYHPIKNINDHKYIRDNFRA
jgi:hypothetical protein